MQKMTKGMIVTLCAVEIVFEQLLNRIRFLELNC